METEKTERPREDIVIFGAGDTSKVVIDIIRKGNRYNLVGIIDRVMDRKEKFCDLSILGSEDSLPYLMRDYPISGGIVAVGDNYTRLKIVENITRMIPGFKFVGAVHPNATLSGDVSIGDGAMLMAGVVVNSHAQVGRHCLLNTNSSLDHDCIMGDFSSIAPGAAVGGRVQIGRLAAVCLGANVINGIEIGEGAVIGAGSTVFDDISSFVVAYGTPCRVVRRRTVDEKYF